MLLYKIYHRQLISLLVCFTTLLISTTNQEKHTNALKWKQSSQIKNNNLDFMQISSSNEVYVNSLDVKRGAQNDKLADIAEPISSSSSSSGSSSKSSSSSSSSSNINNNSHESISIRLKDLQQLMTQMLIDKVNSEKLTKDDEVNDPLGENQQRYNNNLMVSDRILERLRTLAEQFIFEGSSSSSSSDVKSTGRVFLFKGKNGSWMC